MQGQIWYVRLIWPREMRSEIQQLSVENHFAESQDLHSVQFIYIKCHITQLHDVTCHRDGATYHQHYI